MDLLVRWILGYGISIFGGLEPMTGVGLWNGIMGVNTSQAVADNILVGFMDMLCKLSKSQV